MTPEIMICLAILAVAVVLFSWDRIPADVVALGVLLAVAGTGLVPVDKALSGFGSGTVVMILGFFIMTAALSHTGIVDTVGQWILARAGTRPFVLIAVVMVALCVPLAARFRRGGGLGILFALGVGLGFAFFVLDGISLSVGELGFVSPWLGAWMPVLVFAAIAAYLTLQTERV